MIVYTDTEAQRRLADVLAEAERGGSVRIRRGDGSEFELSPVSQASSPLDIAGAGLDLTAAEIVEAVREVRAR
jgi:antitoxin (DNA-binding transcriptional repressor) of toxin-antitoxin stability system